VESLRNVQLAHDEGLRECAREEEGGHASGGTPAGWGRRPRQDRATVAHHHSGRHPWDRGRLDDRRQQTKQFHRRLRPRPYRPFHESTETTDSRTPVMPFNSQTDTD